MDGGGNLVKDEATSVDVDNVPRRRGFVKKGPTFLLKERING